MVLHPLTPAQVPLPLSMTTYGVSGAVLSSSTGLSFHDSNHEQARDDLVHLLSVASLTDSPPLVEAIIVRLSSITRLCLA